MERFCAEASLPTSTSFRIRLVLEEMVLNLIDHAVDSRTDRISVGIDLEPARVVLVPWRTTGPLLIRGPRRHLTKLSRSKNAVRAVINVMSPYSVYAPPASLMHIPFLIGSPPSSDAERGH
jgi:hypothetical protein